MASVKHRANNFGRPVKIHTFLTFLVSWLALSGCHARPPGNPGGTAGKHPVLITIVVDQLAAWMAAERWPELPPGGGFARLRREGLTVRELRFEHANTETAPGHAALYTGAVPRTSGVFANEVIATQGPPRPSPGKPRSILVDDGTRLVSVGGGALPRPGSSLAVLRVETLADAFVASVRDAQVLSFSLKDRGALLAAGRRPVAALWLDPESQSFVTSTAFPSPPPWLIPLADRGAVERARDGGWSLPDADRAWVIAHARTADDQPGEGDYAGLGAVFPHPIGSAKAVRATPVGDRLVFALAAAAVRVAAENGRPTLLALSLSSNDYVLHVFGPHSWEAWAELLELDRQLGGFLAAADRAVGPDNYAVMLTSDHGGTAIPELTGAADPWCPAPASERDRWERGCDPRRRLMPQEVAAQIEVAIARTLGEGSWVAGVAAPFVTLTPRGRGLGVADRARLVAAVRGASARLGIDEVVDVRAAAGPCPNEATSRAALICRTILPDGPADLYFVVHPGVFFDPDVAPGAGMNHGSPYLYDRSVPLLIRAPGRVAAGRVREAPVSFAVFARTAASLLGMRAPRAAEPAEDLSIVP
jgi:arylsulfatase A-like enzyme